MLALSFCVVAFRKLCMETMGVVICMVRGRRRRLLAQLVRTIDQSRRRALGRATRGMLQALIILVVTV